MSMLTKNFPDFLESEEVDGLIERCKQGDSEAKDKLVLHNLKSVSWAVNSQFKNINHDKEDLFSIGVIGLMKAVEKFDYKKDFKMDLSYLKSDTSKKIYFLSVLSV